MSDLADTPRVTRDWCPICEPSIDPLRELVDEVRCAAHKPLALGAADDQVPAALRDASVLGTGDESNDRNAAVCDLIHRGRA